MKARIVLLDNQDSFAYNLVDELRLLGYPLVIYRNDIASDVIQADLDAYQGPQLLCLSPGPGHPTQAGNMLDLIAFCRGRIPILGICLGFQALLHAAGARVDRCAEVVHGKTARIQCQPHEIFAGLPNPLSVARYHSLSGYDLTDKVQVIATYQMPNDASAAADIPMAAWFAENLALGFQFHPESIMTTHGSQLIEQSIHFLFAAAATQAPRVQAADNATEELRG